MVRVEITNDNQTLSALFLFSNHQHAEFLIWPIACKIYLNQSIDGGHQIELCWAEIRGSNQDIWAISGKDA
jgi:hypothetical protein